MQPEVFLKLKILKRQNIAWLLKLVIRLKSIKIYSQPHSKNTKPPLQSPIGYAVQREIAVYSVTKGGEGGCVLTGITFLLQTDRRGGDQKNLLL